MNKSYLTAISRKKLSTPVQWLWDRCKLEGNILDYGCGRGDDVQNLKGRGFNIFGYDPHWGPQTPPVGKYNTVLCTYVLNVVAKDERKRVIDKLRTCCKPSGHIYVTVRRDLKENKIVTSRGTEQYLVKLPYTIEHETNSYCIYSVPYWE